ncbi:SDR family NAD(P)-dependent oxidoreductase [Candidatus Bipolaricaulota bacterium]|nr:SDR family NAD(P)-dependent oxidoreductase [Candidatus Bipolaricaulota bacterium]
MLDRYSTILVTGGSGFIGRHLVNALLSLGKQVVILDNLFTALNKEAPPGTMLVQADVRDYRKIAEVAKGVELIFHLAANASGAVSIEDPRYDLETNAMGTFNVLEVALSARVKRFVYVSSASVYGRPQRFPMDEEHPTRPFMPYGASKLAGELFCHSFFETYGLPVVVARPFCVYGPGENPKLALVEVSRYLRWHLNHRPIQVVGDPERKTRDFVHVSDVVQGLLLIADQANPGEVFNLGSGEEISMRELTEVIGSVTGRTAIVNEIPDVTEDTYRLVADISKIKSLSYVPMVSIVEGVRRLVLELGENPAMPRGATIFKRGQRAEG